MNLRPLDPQSSALPNYATPRQKYVAAKDYCIIWGLYLSRSLIVKIVVYFLTSLCYTINMNAIDKKYRSVDMSDKRREKKRIIAGAIAIILVLVMVSPLLISLIALIFS